MSLLPVCDRCHLPKDTTRHFSLVRQWRKGEETVNQTRHAGSIDLCDDCRGLVTHDGRNSAHKLKVTRIEFGRTSR